MNDFKLVVLPIMGEEETVLAKLKIKHSDTIEFLPNVMTRGQFTTAIDQSDFDVVLINKELNFYNAALETIKNLSCSYEIYKGDEFSYIDNRIKAVYDKEYKKSQAVYEDKKNINKIGYTPKIDVEEYLSEEDVKKKDSTHIKIPKQNSSRLIIGVLSAHRMSGASLFSMILSGFLKESLEVTPIVIENTESYYYDYFNLKEDDYEGDYMSTGKFEDLYYHEGVLYGFKLPDTDYEN